MFRFRKERRWDYVVDKGLQNKIVVASTWPIAAASVVSLVVLFLFGAQLKRLAVTSGVEVTGLGPLFLATTLLFLYAIVSQVILALKLSHRVAGSAHRIKKTLEAYRRGECDLRVQLRGDDLHGDLAGEVNEFLDWVGRETAAAPGRSEPRRQSAPRSVASRAGKPAG